MKASHFTFVTVTALAITLGGCQSPERRSSMAPTTTAETTEADETSPSAVAATPVANKPKPAPKRRSKDSIADVACLYEQKPWLNLDAASDRTPEGIRFRVFLDPGDGRGVLRDGTLHVEMYQVKGTAAGGLERTLVSDWHYPMDALSPVRSKLLGMGYMVRLGWARKDLAGQEVELTARFEQPDGLSVVSGTKRLRIPKYAF